MPDAAAPPLPRSTRVDRTLHRRILEKLVGAYPNPLEPSDLDMAEDDPAWNFAAAYLADHGLVSVTRSSSMAGFVMVDATVTAKGIDFLENDGGLGAMLGVVTVRFDTETVRQLLLAKVDASTLPQPEKSRLKAKLEDLGGDVLKDVTKRVLDAAIDHWPDALQLLSRLTS